MVLNIANTNNSIQYELFGWTQMVSSIVND